MNLWVGVHFLFAGLCLSSSAPTPEECRDLVAPLSLSDPSAIHGKFHFIMGYTDSELYNSILKLTDSSWLKISASPDDVHSVSISQDNRINGTCMSSVTTSKINGDTMNTEVHNVTTVAHVLQSGSNSLSFYMNSTARNIGQLLKKININSPAPEEIISRAFYLTSREATAKDSDVEQFKKQASCLGFTAEPTFQYDPKNEYCAEGEGIRV